MFSLPVAAHRTQFLLLTALAMAGSMTVKSHPEGPMPSPAAYWPKLMLITLAPLLAAELIPAATSVSVQFWNATGMIWQLPATPATPSALLNLSATIPAQHVP